MRRWRGTSEQTTGAGRPATDAADRRSRPRALLRAAVGWGVIAVLLCRAGAVGAPAGQSFMDAYSARLQTVRGNLPQITACAERAARRWVTHERVYLHLVFGGDNSNFSMELCSRAGGLGNIMTVSTRRQREQITPHDVLLIGPRSWEKGADFWLQKLPEFRKEGWLIVAFASTNGMPEGLPCDALIDNGAATGAHEEGALNSVVNITQGWLWCCELVSALTRLGKSPAILEGMFLPGAGAHNRDVGHPGWEPTLFPCDTSIEAGRLAAAFLAEVETEMTRLGGLETQARIAQAAELAAARIQSGKTVWMSSFTHFLDGEVFDNNRSPFQAFRGISCGENGETFRNNMKEGDLLFWWGEWTLNMPWRDYQEIIRETGADYIPSFRRLRPGEAYEGYPRTDDVSDALFVLDQDWPFEGAVVPIPFPPGKMAPITGIHSALLYRMLDEAVFLRLQTD